ncbi:exosortase C-terminal domain/associated protein EpsI [Thermodesulfobacteriota bacterium]
MGQINRTRIIILILCFTIIGILVNLKPESTAAVKRVQLHEALSNIKGWNSPGLSTLDSKIVEALELDKYTNQAYTNGSDRVFLYIGYYLISKKVGAAHDPLVCFPGQGWVLTNRSTGKLRLYPETDEAISYSSMVATIGSKRDLLVYWFQAYDLTNPDTFSQKLGTLWNKILHRGEDNAFVRVSTPVGDKTLSEAYETAFSFIRAFYPAFLEYVKDGNENRGRKSGVK